jgi:hypothetical protein
MHLVRLVGADDPCLGSAATPILPFEIAGIIARGCQKSKSRYTGVWKLEVGKWNMQWELYF